MALGVLGFLTIVGVTVSKITTSGRWNTIFTSDSKRAEECAEASTNMMFKVIKDNMNDYSIFYKLFSKPSSLFLDTSKKDFCFMYFRLPAFIVGASVDGLNFNGKEEDDLDLQLDLFNQVAFKKFYEDGFTFIYDTLSPDPKAPLAPLSGMFESLGGRVRVVCTGKIKKAFGILASDPKYAVSGINIPLSGVTGFMGKLFDKVKINGKDYANKVNGALGNDPAKEENDGTIGIDLISFLPDDPLLKAPDIGGITLIVEGAPIKIGEVHPIYEILQGIIDKIFAKIVKAAGLTPRQLAQKLLGDSLTFKIDLSAIMSKIEDAIKNCLPDFLQLFAGNATWDITVEKQGIFEVESIVYYTPHYPDGKTIVKKLVAEREFRVADIQPIAPDHTFFIANSAKLYESPGTENADNWEGDDQIDWDAGNGDLIVHNMPSLKSIFNTLKNLFTFKFEALLREIQLPGLVRVNGTKEMDIKITMFKKLGFSDEILYRMEVLALALGHKDGDETTCNGDHPSSHSKNSHSLIPRLVDVLYNFWADGEPFDWGYFGGGSPGGNGSYWLPIPPRFARTQLFGNLHLEFPFSLRVEGNLRKVYSHIKMLLVKIYIPPIPIIGFLGLDIPVPWLWAKAKAEPYGFCRFPPYKEKEDAQKQWSPNEKNNLPANTYSPTQYLKKASYFYNTSAEFQRDLDNRCIEYNGKKTFICDGVTFVNDNLWLPKMHVMGRGIIVSAANVHIDGNITREDFDKDGNSTVFSVVARNGSIITGFGKREVSACLFADRGIIVPIGGGLTVNGNLCVNRFNRSDIGGDVHVYYESNHCRSSLLSMIRPVAKYDPTRYYVTFSSKLAHFKFEKITEEDLKNAQ